MKKAFLSLGSNLGNKIYYINSGIESIKKLPGTKVLNISSYYETEPWVISDNNKIKVQDKYINCCVEIMTEFSPEILLGMCLGIETCHGRTREYRCAPRTLDIDLLLYENETRDQKNLVLPHPRLLERNFILIPLKDVFNININNTSFGNINFKNIFESCNKLGVHKLNL